METNTAANDSQPPRCRPRAPAGPSQTAYTPTQGLPIDTYTTTDLPASARNIDIVCDSHVSIFSLLLFLTV